MQLFFIPHVVFKAVSILHQNIAICTVKLLHRVCARVSLGLIILHWVQVCLQKLAKFDKPSLWERPHRVK